VGGTLFIVGTPIGNLADASPRVRETLASADVVAAEDTRRTGRLLEGFGIKASLVSLYDANERERSDELLRHLRNGRSVAIVSDGGMPLVSDPGYLVVRDAIAEGVDVRVVPGPSSVIAAVVVSGLPPDRFAFEGFVSKRPGERMRRLESVSHDPRTLVYFESPLRVPTTLRDMLVAFGDRRVAVCRELTKLHEEVTRGRISEVLAALGERELKGEVVIVVEGERAPATPDLHRVADEARSLVADGMRTRDAAREVAERHGISVNDLYRALVSEP
jgi:16S rRNA (cytidine1402-2'-O)-methyltransferase